MWGFFIVAASALEGKAEIPREGIDTEMSLKSRHLRSTGVAMELQQVHSW
jgi:hypothetical protein